LGQVVAGNFAGGLLAYFGADVIKVGVLCVLYMRWVLWGLWADLWAVCDMCDVFAHFLI
jgi:hypothetical protein